MPYRQAIRLPPIRGLNRWLITCWTPSCGECTMNQLARGAAIGIFWAFVLPAGQILAAVANSVWWRANIPVAAGLTLITNPFTIGFWLWLAYKAGSFGTGRTATASSHANHPKRRYRRLFELHWCFCHFGHGHVCRRRLASSLCFYQSHLAGTVLA